MAAAPAAAWIVDKGLVSDRAVIDTAVAKYSDHLQTHDASAPPWFVPAPLCSAVKRIRQSHSRREYTSLATFRRKNEGLSPVFSLPAGPPFSRPVQVATPADQRWEERRVGEEYKTPTAPQP